MIATVVGVTLLGAICGLDVVSFPQVMISRPIVAATAGGTLTGRPLEGLVLGAILELIALDTLPFGASKYPEWGSAAAVGGVLVGLIPHGTRGAMPACLLAALVTAAFSEWSMTALRRANAARTRAILPQLEAGSGAALVGLQLRGLTADFVRAGLLSAIAFLVLHPLVLGIVSTWTLAGRISHAVIVGVAGMLAVGAAWNAFHTTRGAGWMFALGLTAGLVLVTVR
jgi:mannose/fructose/N-acetylgalactosamine-specific phosphotransferase system component IIC